MHILFRCAMAHAEATARRPVNRPSCWERFVMALGPVLPEGRQPAFFNVAPRGRPRRRADPP